eukprot:4772432-Prymnesium_polylepis.1
MVPSGAMPSENAMVSDSSSRAVVRRMSSMVDSAIICASSSAYGIAEWWRFESVHPDATLAATDVPDGGLSRAGMVGSSSEQGGAFFISR